MKIDRLPPDEDYYRRRERHLERLLGYPSDREARPCPGCTLTCPSCGSTTCTCNCSPDCGRLPLQLTSDPERHPIEPAITPLVHAPTATGIMHPCWSCEGHLDPRGTRLQVPPRVWFYARASAYPALLGDYIWRLRFQKALKHDWRVSLVSFGNPLDSAYSIEPNLADVDSPNLDHLRQDVRTIATGLADALKAMARKRRKELAAELD